MVVGPGAERGIIGGSTPHSVWLVAPSASWTEGIKTVDRSEKLFNELVNQPLPPDALPPRRRVESDRSSQPKQRDDGRSTSSVLDLSPFRMTATHMKASATETMRQHRKMQPHMRSDVDEVVFGRDLDGSDLPEARSTIRADILAPAGRLPVRKAPPQATRTRADRLRQREAQERQLQKSASASAQIEGQRAVTTARASLAHPRREFVPTEKPNRITLDTSDTFHNTPFLSKNRAVESWAVYRNSSNPMLNYHPGDPRLPDMAQAHSTSMLSHGSLNSVAGRDAMETMRLTATSSSRGSLWPTATGPAARTGERPSTTSPAKPSGRRGMALHRTPTMVCACPCLRPLRPLGRRLRASATSPHPAPHPSHLTLHTSP